AVPRAGLPGARAGGAPAPRRGGAGGDGAAALPPAGGQWSPPGHPMSTGLLKNDPIAGPSVGPGLVMTERTACPSILALALLLWGVEPAVDADQPPAAAQGTRTADATPRAPSPASTAPPALNSIARPSIQPTRGALPSAVSSAIERFVRQSGRDVPPSPPPF